MYYFALRRVGLADAEARAEDVTHEVFLTTWRRLDSVPLDLNEARAWLFAVARNHILHEQRNSARRAALAIRVADDAIGRAGAAPDADAVAQLDFHTAWQTLSPTDQETIALTAFEEMTSAQAAQVLGISATAYRVRLHHARNKLRRLLAATSPHVNPTQSIIQNQPRHGVNYAIAQPIKQN